MSEQKLFKASRDWLKSAVEALHSAGIEVLAPVENEEGVTNLMPVTKSEEIKLNYGNVNLPLKRLFFPETEVLIEFEHKEGQDIEVAPQKVTDGERVVIGSRPCDAAALEVLDKVFGWDYDDQSYRARRERTTVISLACTEPGTECFCTSVGYSPHSSQGSDVLVFMDDQGKVLMDVHTDKGKKFIERLSSAVEAAQQGTKLPVSPEVEKRFDPEKVKPWLDANFESDFWLDASLRCVGCGSCSYLCPTCHCFDIVDEASWNMGERRRNWDCCSFALFTLHASGHNPRPNQAARYRQRIMHKFKYFPERFEKIACVGCGRCVKNCGVGQNMLNILTDIEKGPEKNDESIEKQK